MAAMNRMVLAVMVALACLTGCGPPPAEPPVPVANGVFRSQECGFEAAFPEQPEVSSKWLSGGPIEIPSVTFNHADEVEDMAYWVNCQTYPDPFAESSLPQHLNIAQKRFQDIFKLKLLDQQSVALGKQTVRECWFENPKGHIYHCLFAFHRNHELMFAVIHGGDNQSAELSEKFIRSVRLLD